MKKTNSFTFSMLVVSLICLWLFIAGIRYLVDRFSETIESHEPTTIVDRSNDSDTSQEPQGNDCDTKGLNCCPTEFIDKEGNCNDVK